MSENWKVLPHGRFVKLAENVWCVEGSLPNISLKRTMTVARRSDGRLVIHSAIALDDAGMTELESFGTPAFLLVPNAFHRMDAPKYARRYPTMKVFTPRGSRKKVEERVKVDATYDEFPHDDAIRIETLRGVGDVEGAMIVRSNDGVTLVMNDAVFNMPQKPSDVLGWVFTTVMGSAPGTRVSRLFKLAAVKDKRALRADFERLAETPELRRLIVAHGAVAHGEDAASALRKAATYL